MIDDPALGLDMGGTLWFVDLTQPDPSLALPVLALVVSCVNLELVLGRRKEAQLRDVPDQLGTKGPPLHRRIKSLLQGILLLSSPLVAHLPSGVFLYWIPNALYGTAQHALLPTLIKQKSLQQTTKQEQRRDRLR